MILQRAARCAISAMVVFSSNNNNNNNKRVLEACAECLSVTLHGITSSAGGYVRQGWVVCCRDDGP